MQLMTTSDDATNPLFAHLLASMSDEVRATFSELQLTALARSTQAHATQHLVDYRVSAPLLFGRRYYVTLLIGRERRNLSRLDSEGQSQVTRIAMLYSALTAMLVGLLLFGMFCAVYLLKSFSGINLFDGESPLHPLYMLLRQR